MNITELRQSARAISSNLSQEDGKVITEVLDALEQLHEFAMRYHMRRSLSSSADLPVHNAIVGQLTTHLEHMQECSYQNLLERGILPRTMINVVTPATPTPPTWPQARTVPEHKE